MTGSSASISASAAAALSSSGSSGGARRPQALSLWKSGGLKAAQKGFAAALASAPNDPRALRGVGMAAFKRLDYEAARTSLQDLHTGLSESDWSAATERHLRKPPQKGSGQLVSTILAPGQRPNEQQIKSYKEDMIDAKMLRALSLAHLRIAQNATLKENCDHEVNRVVFSAAQRAFAPALRHMENAADPGLLLDAAMCYEGLADWQGALTIYGSIITGFPRYTGMTFVVVRAVAVLAQSGQLPTAAAYIERVLDLPPTQAGFTSDDMMFILARVYELAGRRREANDTYKECHRLYTKKQVRILQRRQQRGQNPAKAAAGDGEIDSTLVDIDPSHLHEGPAPECCDYGSFRAWRSWYDSPETWRRRSLRFNTTLRLPIFAADSIVEVLKREQQQQIGGGASAETWLRLSRIKDRMGDKAVSLQAALKALELNRYNLSIRELVTKKDPEGWGRRFEQEETNATTIQRCLYRGWKGRWLAFRARNEAALQWKSATFVQRIWRGKCGRRIVAAKRKRVEASIQIQAVFRRKAAGKRVANLRAQHAAARRIQKRVRIAAKRRAAAIEIQRMWRGHLGIARCVIFRLLPSNQNPYPPYYCPLTQYTQYTLPYPILKIGHVYGVLKFSEQPKCRVYFGLTVGARLLARFGLPETPRWTSSAFFVDTLHASTTATFRLDSRVLEACSASVGVGACGAVCVTSRVVQRLPCSAGREVTWDATVCVSFDHPRGAIWWRPPLLHSCVRVPCNRIAHGSRLVC